MPDYVEDKKRFLEECLRLGYTEEYCVELCGCDKAGDKIGKIRPSNHRKL